MRLAAHAVPTAATAGAVGRGFSVVFAEGARACLEEIRFGDDGLELIVAVDAASSPREAAAGVEAVGGIVRLPARHSSRIAGPPEEAS